MQSIGDHGGSGGASQRGLPPVTELGIGVMILVIIGGIYLAAQIPGSVSLAPALALLIGAGLLLAADAVILSRVRGFAWHIFRRVYAWALLAYIVIAGMIEYTFIIDGTPWRILVTFSAMLALFAIDIPLILAFSVARYQTEGPGAQT
jgi:hypothetical protein